MLSAIHKPSIFPHMESRKWVLAIWLALIAGFFLWSRLDFSNRIYYFGDGNVVVEMIRLMLGTHEWDPNWTRLADHIQPQAELIPYMPMPRSTDIFYNLAGYMIMGAAVCKALYLSGFSSVPIQNVLHGANVILQLLTLWLLFRIGCKLASQTLGLLAVTLFVAFPLAVMEAHYERPESWLCLLATSMVYCSLFFREAPRRNSLLLGVLIGLSVACKLSQLFLGLIPAVLFLYYWLDPAQGSLVQRSKKLCAYSALAIIGIVVAIAINAPFMLQHVKETPAAIKLMSSFYATPTYPYALEHYSYIEQLYISLRYFWYTLGSAWCFLLLAGIVHIFGHYPKNSFQERGFYLALATPLVLFLFYFAIHVNFVERNFSPLQGIISLISALGFFSVVEVGKKFVKNKTTHYVGLIVAIILVFYTPMKINLDFVQRYIHHPDQPHRADFQDLLKNDFHGFWVKNVYFTFKITGETPEKPVKAPRLYQIDDLNEYWTRDYLTALERNGFVKVGTYCSEFSNLPPNTLTLYHAAAKNHYYVRRDEWPANVPTGYFKTNCT